MSNSPKDMQTIKNDLHNIITPHINYLNLEGFIVIDTDIKILKIHGDDYLVIDGKDAFYYNTITSKVKLHQTKDKTVVDDCNSGIKKYDIVENVWNKNFVRAKDLNSLQQAQLNQMKVFIKDNDLDPSDIDSVILSDPNKATREIIKGVDYTLFNF